VEDALRLLILAFEQRRWDGAAAGSGTHRALIWERPGFNQGFHSIRAAL
jgi:hypothetical protein